MPPYPRKLKQPPDRVLLEQYDHFLRTADWLAERDLPVALTLVETLQPALGPDAVIFPPTYAAARRGGNDHPYAISIIRADMAPQEAAKQDVEANICDLDSVGSQANRMEPEFKREGLASLVPQVFIKTKDARVSLLDAGHRVADGAVRFTDEFGQRIAPAIKAMADHADASALARIAPTSLLFGFWDSRNQDYQYKHPRLLGSTIRATNVAVLKRSAQYNPTFDPALLAKSGNLGVDASELVVDEQAEPEKKAEADKKNPLSQEGLLAAPSVDTHGGVRVFGRIIRRTEINLVGLRALAVTAEGTVNEAESLKMRRYLFGLALVAARVQSAYNLRQGCLLVGAEGTTPKTKLMLPSGQGEEFAWNFAATLEFAKAAAQDFGVAEAEEFNFVFAKVLEATKGRAAAKTGKKAKG